jgi:hypothetical protein
VEIGGYQAFGILFSALRDLRLPKERITRREKGSNEGSFLRAT